jgi:hypothetical protein
VSTAGRRLAAGLVCGAAAVAFEAQASRDRSGAPLSGAAARAAAAERAAAVPLPAGGTFHGIRWEHAGTVTRAGIDAVLQYNAACQWLRAWRDRRERARAIAMLRAVPGWSAMRGTESAAVLTRVAAEVRAGGGENARLMLAGCDASHAREVEYAARMGLTPSR